MSYQAAAAAAHRQADLLLPRFADKDKFGRPAVAAAAAVVGDHPTLAVGDKLADAAADRGPPSHRKRVWESDREFNIQLSRIATARELLAAASHESMLVYTQRVAESRRSRGLHIPPPAAAGGMPLRADAVDLSSLLVRATHISRRAAAGRHGAADGGARSPVGATATGFLRRSSIDAGGGVKSKSLPNMKLEPLLGGRERYKLGLSDADRLKDLLGLRNVSDRQRLPRLAIGTRTTALAAATAASPFALPPVAPDGSEPADKGPTNTAQALQVVALPAVVPQPQPASSSEREADVDAAPDAAEATEASPKRRQQPLDLPHTSKSGLGSRTDRSEDAGGTNAGPASHLERRLVNESTANVNATADTSGKNISGRNEGELDYGTFAVVGADQPTPRGKGAAASGGSRRSKKPKRMRIVAPNLSSIPEDELEEDDDAADDENDVTVDADYSGSLMTASLAVGSGVRLSHAQDEHAQHPHHTYRHIALPHILDVIGEVEPAYDEAFAAVAAAAAATKGARVDSVEERRKDLAILRRVNAAATDGSLLQAHQKSMKSLAKRKLRRLPPIQGLDSDE